MIRSSLSFVVMAAMLASTSPQAFGEENTAIAANSSQRQSAAKDGADIATLREELKEQQKQIEELRKTLEQQNKILEKLTAAPANATEANAAPKEPASIGQVASTRAIVPAAPIPSALPLALPMAMQKEGQPVPAPNPLQLHVGESTLTPIGFMDFTSVWRSAATGNGIGTNFGSVPYNNAVNYHLPENRLSPQNSRVGFRFDSTWHDTHVLGYMEADFLGFVPTNAAVSSNSFSNRMRLYWLDLRKGGVELLAGQSWSLMTPNRKGVGGLPGDLFYSQDIDVNYQNGLPWSRQAGIRLAIHSPEDKINFALAFENQEQYIGGSGGGGVVTLPSAFSSSNFNNQVNNGGTTLSAPQFQPDIIAKVAFDPAKAFHFEITGLERTFHTYGPTTHQTYTTAGGGVEVNANLEVFKGFQLITNNYWSDGGGRYLFGVAPDLIIRSNGAPSLIHAGGVVEGFEATMGKTLLYAYYGGTYIGKNVAVDTTGSKPALVGYGFTGSSNAQNRTVQEITFGFNRTFWKDPKYGAVNFMGQYSYLFRNPWYVATGTARDTHINMLFFNLRYTLPGTAPSIKY